jgi:hypothetical protein
MRTEQLRGKILELSYICPKGQHEPGCPFKKLGSLGHDTRKHMLGQMEHPEILALFDLTPSQCPADPRNSFSIQTKAYQNTGCQETGEIKAVSDQATKDDAAAQE